MRYFAAAAALVFALSTGAAAQLGSRPADEWVKTLETPARIQTLKMDEVIQKLNIRPGSVVADIGAGTGLFEGALANAAGNKGTVYAEDIDQELLNRIASRARDLKIANVKTVLGAFTDPKLPTNNVDLALINDVLHHIQDRAAFLKSLSGYIKPDGRIAVIDFYPERGSHRAEPELQITKEQTAGWMAAAGFKTSTELDLFPDKWFIVYSR